MRTRVHVFISAAGDPGLAVRALRHAGRPDLADGDPGVTGLLATWFWDGSPELDQLQASLEEHGVSWTWRKEVVFSERELREATLLRLIVARSPKSSGGAAAGTRYDLSSGCPRCGTGATQTSSLILRKAETPKRGKIFITAQDILVATEVAHLLTEQMVTGLEFREAIAWRTAEPLGWQQWLATHQMPPWSPQTSGGERENPCPHCGRDGHYDHPRHPLLLTYRRADLDLDALPDVTRTWECFGKSWITPPSERHIAPSFAQPLVLVRPKVRAAMREAGVTHLRYEPVAITSD